MSRFNEKKKVVNLANGKAYKMSCEMKLASMLLTSFADDKYYRTAKGFFNELEKTIAECDKEFAAKAVIFARCEFGMRSVSHYAASILAKYIGGEEYAARFFDNVIRRPDDVTEILACHLGRGQKVSNAMKKGFSKAIGRFSEYQLAKYKGENNEVKLVDAVNMVHPLETKKTNGALRKLVNGELKQFDTWENELSAAGSDNAKRMEVWKTLVEGKKLGYFALLRNLRNIALLNNESLLKTALNALTDKEAIKGSLVLPFRFSTAYNELSKVNSECMSAIAEACDISCGNMPEFEGRTLIALDVSGSMHGRPSEIGALFTAAIFKKNNADIILFDDRARYVHANRNDSVITIAKGFKFYGGGTNFCSVFENADKAYDRVILLSDMQSWEDNVWTRSAKGAFEKYKIKFECPNCKFYSFDLAGYGTLELPQKDVYCLAGFSEKVFDIMEMLETDENALVNKIKSVKL